MAYSQNAPYEPPRRQYYGQQQPAMQNGYGGGYEDEYHGYDQQYYDQGYEQGYDRTYEQYNGYQEDMRPPGRHPQPNGYAPQQRQERQYDPRYRQRPEAPRPTRHEQDPRQQRHHQSPPAQPTQYRDRPQPNDGRFQSAGYQQPPSQPNGRPAATYQQRPRPQDPSAARPGTAPQPAKNSAPSKMTMEQWKAKEKARMQADALSPEIMAQDNAFPVFPTYQNRSRPGTANGTHDEAPRKSTDTGNAGRPSMSRGNSHDNREAPPSQQQTLQRPSLEQRPFSFEPMHGQPNAQIQQRALPINQEDSTVAPRPGDYAHDQVQYLQDRQQSPPTMSNPTRRPIAQPNGYNGEPNARQHAQPQPAPQPRQMHPRGPPMQRIDTQQIQQAPQPGYMDHQPLSPAVVPPRPATAQGRKPRNGNNMISPMSAHSQTAPYGQYNDQAWTQQGMMLQNGPGAHSYSDPRAAPPVTAAPMTRDQEIESEMPDFDSAAPGGTSLLHKRAQAASPTSPLQQNPSDPSLSMPQQRFYNQHPDQSSTSPPDPRQPRPRGDNNSNGLASGVPTVNAQYQHYEQPYQQSPPQDGFSPTGHVPSFQPPYARDQAPRRSMDDARQMPNRQGPPNAQRPMPNGRPLRGPYPPQQQRPPDDRNMSAQTAWSEPMPDRVGSAPPRQAMQSPVGRAPMGAPLSQQRSAPDRPVQDHRHSNPDSLPHHPAPVRPGLMDGGAGMGPGSKPPPVRNYNGTSQPQPQQRRVSVDPMATPVTLAELERLRQEVNANPANNKRALLLAKRLVEAGAVLAPEGGRADARSAARNRERYILDAHKIVKKLVTSGYPEAQFYMADCYGSGELGLEPDPREAFKLYQAAAKAGHPEAAYRTAMCCELGAEDGGGTSRDYAKAVQWYRRAAALGDSAGMFKVGVILLKGLLGQQRNVGEAINFLKRSIQIGESENPHALHELALMYESSNTNPEIRNKIIADDTYALELFQRAAKLGHKAAQFRLGQAYEYGNLGLAIDNRASISWYSKAAAQGEHQAELALSGWYLTGAEGILEHSDMEAYLWARKAASSEPPLAKAMFAMGYFTETGIGCPVSIEEAKKWYGRAASYNFPKARERLEELRRNPQKGQRQRDGKLTRNQKKDESECVVM